MNETIEKYLKDELINATLSTIWDTSPRPIASILKDWHNRIDTRIVDDACRIFPEISHQEMVDKYCQILTNVCNDAMKSRPENEQQKIRGIIAQRCNMFHDK